MRYDTKGFALLTLAITSILSSRAAFLFVEDPEGPNLLIVAVAAAIMYAISLALYAFLPSISVRPSPHRLLAVICAQIAILLVLYFWLN